MGNKNMFWLMVLGCALPLMAVFMLPLFGITAGSGLVLLLFILCPVMHLFMMRGMHGHGDKMPDNAEPGAPKLTLVEKDNEDVNRYPSPWIRNVSVISGFTKGRVKEVRR